MLPEPTVTEPPRRPATGAIGSREGAIPSGPAVAAYTSSMLGVLTLSFVNLGTEASTNFKDLVDHVGKLWMPGAAGIGPYSGKETLGLIMWVGSWLLLHRLWHRRELNEPKWLLIFCMGMGLATLFLWPPVIHHLVE